MYANRLCLREKLHDGCLTSFKKCSTKIKVFPASIDSSFNFGSKWVSEKKKLNGLAFLLTVFIVHFLPDYKAILSKGKVRCAGSSLFLKNRFGIGYHLK